MGCRNAGSQSRREQLHRGPQYIRGGYLVQRRGVTPPGVWASCLPGGRQNSMILAQGTVDAGIRAPEESHDRNPMGPCQVHGSGVSSDKETAAGEELAQLGKCHGGCGEAGAAGLREDVLDNGLFPWTPSENWAKPFFRQAAD